MSSHILIVEDEHHLALGLKFNFEAEGYRVSLAPNALEASKLLGESSAKVNLIILDLMLPGKSGYALCEEVRNAGNTVPILMLTARTLTEDKIRGFDAGTDQYMTKPFELSELISRAKNLLRRSQREADSPMAGANPVEVRPIGKAMVNFATYEVSVNGVVERTLTQMEVNLLRVFLESEGRILTRAELLDRVWGVDNFPSTRTVDNFILRFRKYFEIDQAEPRHFLSVRSAGYRFIANPGNGET